MAALFFFFISDALNKLLVYLDHDFNRASIIVRSIYEALFISVILIFLNKERFTFLVLFAIAFGLFITGQYLFSSTVSYQYDVVENIFIFNKYYFIFIVYFTFYKLKTSPEKFVRVIKWVDRIFVFNSIAVIAGAFFQIDFLRTYITQSYRYGYSGFIPVQNEATFFFFIVISYFYYKHFVLKRKSLNFWVVLSASLLLGTKGIYVYLGILLLFHFLRHSSFQTKFITFLVTIVFFLGLGWYLSGEKSKDLIAYFLFQKEKSGWLTMLLSGRNLTIQEKGAEIIFNWKPLNYLIGGQDQTKFLMEMDLIDLYFFFGLTGALIYIALIFMTFFNLNLRNLFNLLFISSYFILACFGGHFFSSAINALYLCLVSMHFYISQKRPVQPSE